MENEMKVIIDLCVIPMGVGVSVSEYVVACHEVLKDAGYVSASIGKYTRS